MSRARRQFAIVPQKKLEPRTRRVAPMSRVCGGVYAHGLCCGIEVALKKLLDQCQPAGVQLVQDGDRVRYHDGPRPRVSGRSGRVR